MRWPRLNALWITLGTLAVLLVLLAALQHRWLGDLGRAEAARRQGQLERSASRFQWAFDRELAQTLFAFRPDPGDARGVRTLLVERLADLRRRDADAIVSGLLLVSRAPGGEITLERCDAGSDAFRPAAFTAPLETLRQRMGSGEAGREGFRPTLIHEPPALAFPTMAPGGPPASSPAGPQGPGFPRWGGFAPTGYVVVLLDVEKLRTHLLPALAETHFGPLSESEFVVAVTRRADGSVLYSSDPAMTALDLARADARRSLPGFDGRFGPPERRGPGDRDAWRGDPERPRGPDPRGETRTAPSPEPRPDGGFPPGLGPPASEGSSLWLLVVRHRGGSLEQAVARVRRRNLAIGLGVLALLGTAGAVLAVSAQRAQGLARQQIEFVAGVTHEINTPLAAIRSAGQNLADGIVTEPQSVRRYGQLIEREGARLAALVAQALDFAGIASASRAYAAEPVTLAPLVDEALGDLRLVLEQGDFTVEKDIPADLPPVRGDAAALRRVVTNLVANATKFAAQGRWVGVRAARGSGDRVVLRVEDRGPGIARDERDRVFEPFYRGRARERNETPGAGLGLSLVRHVVRAHGGEARIEAREGGGAAVVVELPAVRDTGRPS